jgi:synapsin
VNFPGDYDIRVEQAEFSEISVTASGDGGAVVSVVSYRTGSKVSRKSDLWRKKLQMCSSQATRSFRPDFVLVRQAPRDGSKDFRSTLLGFKFGGVPSINSLNSLLQFQVGFFPVLLAFPLDSLTLVAAAHSFWTIIELWNKTP